ncbi:MAG: hypothetical protein ACLFTK_08620 [Anaerolineales bacterium]
MMLRKLGQLCALGILALGLGACAAESAPRVMTSQPTQTSSPTPTLAATPSATFNPLPTVTLAPTRTPPSADEPPANPLRPTFTLLPATQTATFASTLNPEINIEYFVTNSNQQLAPGETTTLFWRTTGADAVRVFRLNAEDERVQVWNVPVEGRLSVRLEAEPGSGTTRFLLLAERGEVAREEILVFDTGCTSTWFFQPAPGGCPAASLSATHVIQRFETGVMIWVDGSREIFILFEDGDAPAWQRFDDAYQDGMPESDPAIQPPQGRLQPVRGFGLLWREQPTIRARLGWAVTPEIGYDGIIQRATSSADAPSVYLRAQDGGVYNLQSGGVAWQTLLPADIEQVQIVGPQTNDTPPPTAETENSE